MPLLIVPGTAEAAEDYRDLLDMLLPRRAIVLSLRGRGSSASPQSGYGFWEVVSDVQAVIEALDLRRFALYAFSSGVPLAIGAASRCLSVHAPGRVAGLIVGDYPAQARAYPPAWVEKFLASTSRGVPVSEKLMRHVVLGIQRESDDIPLWDLLPGITCPVLILRGGQRLPAAGGGGPAVPGAPAGRARDPLRGQRPCPVGAGLWPLRADTGAVPHSVG